MWASAGSCGSRGSGVGEFLISEFGVVVFCDVGVLIHRVVIVNVGHDFEFGVSGFTIPYVALSVGYEGDSKLTKEAERLRIASETAPAPVPAPAPAPAPAPVDAPAPAPATTTP